MAAAKTTTEDTRHMRHALALAQRGLGCVAPNPSVGCILVLDGRVVGRGWTQPGGRPHAETVALDAAGDLARGATAYVTLEPCSHHGKTPPCADALIASGVSRVVVATGDPDPRVSGRGIEMLRQAGIDVTIGVMEPAARLLNHGFMTTRSSERAAVTLKLATSMDGRIATGTGDAKWITGPSARRFGHLLRATHDAILVGAGTARADDPELTCRIDGLQSRSPRRVILDTGLSLSLTGRLVSTARETPVSVFCGSSADADRQRALIDAGVSVKSVQTSAAGQPDPAAVLQSLSEAGMTRVLIEGGSRIAATFLHAGLVDEIALFRAPIVIGGDGLPAIGGLGLHEIADAAGFMHTATRNLGEDVLETYRRDA